MTNYQFFCKRCSGQESYVKRPATFSQMCHTALANLLQKNLDREFFSKDKVCIFVYLLYVQVSKLCYIVALIRFEMLYDCSC